VRVPAVPLPGYRSFRLGLPSRRVLAALAGHRAEVVHLAGPGDTLRAPRVPFTGGYRVLWRRRRLAALLARLRPDALEVSDRTTLRWTGAWARAHGVPAVMVSHESVTALLRLLLGRRLARARLPRRARRRSSRRPG